MSAPAEEAAAQHAPLVRPGFGARLGLALCLALVLAYSALIATTIAKDGLERYVRKADFLIVLTGASILLDGHPAQLYDETAQQTAQATLLRAAGYEPLRLLPFNHPAFEALLVAGLEAAGLSPGVCFLLWTLLSLAAIAGTLIVLRREWPIGGAPGLLLTGMALTFFPISAGLLLGQSTALVLFGWAAGSVALRRGHDGWAGAAFALAMLKPQAVPVLLLAILLTRRWRALAAWAATVAGAVVVTLPILGLDWPVRYLAFVLRVAAWPPSPALDPAAMQNWRGLAVRLLGDGTAATAITAVLTLLSLALVAWIWWRPAPAQPRWDQRWAVTLLVALLVDPHLLPHDLALAVVPGWILAAQALASVDRRMLAWLLVGWVCGLAAVLARDLFLPPAVLWLVLTLALLLRRDAPIRQVAPAKHIF